LKVTFEEVRKHNGRQAENSPFEILLLCIKLRKTSSGKSIGHGEGVLAQARGGGGKRFDWAPFQRVSREGQSLVTTIRPVQYVGAKKNG